MISLIERSKEHKDEFSSEIIVAKVNGEYRELNTEVKETDKVEFFDLNDPTASRIYINGLVYLTIHSYRKLFNSNLKVNHSLDKGLYLTSEDVLDQEKLNRLKSLMLEKIEADIPFKKCVVARKDAIDFYEKVGAYVKAKNLIYNTNTYVTLYKLEDSYEYFYSLMPVSTGCLKSFELNYIDEHGFVITFPTMFNEDHIDKYIHRDKILNLYKESRNWAKRIGLEFACDLNEAVSKSEISDIIKMDEALKTNKIDEIADEISSKNDVKIVLIAGPSSSGKTTTCNKLKLALKGKGKTPIMISMDDYFVEREETPLDKDGNPDYECLESIDLELFDKTIAGLLNNEEVTIPSYNFLLGKKEFKTKLKMENDDILLIEGIHAMNPKILDNINSDKKIKIYLSALSEINVDRHIRVSTTDNRLLRRIIRDNRTRGYKVEDTLKSWIKVRKGEETYIFPYQDQADYMLNTSTVYELGVLKVYVEPLLYSVSKDSDYYEEAKRLINFLRVFLPIPADDIPSDSIIREFIGGGCFKV